MYGFLSQKEMNDLISAGFDLKIFFEDNFYDTCYYVVEKVKPLTREEKQEMIESGDEQFVDTAVTLESEEVLIINKDEEPNFPPNYKYYLTLSTDDLITFLETYFTCDYKICCKKIYYYSYSKIEYFDNDRWESFELKDYVIYLKELLCKFIIYLLKEKKHLLFRRKIVNKSKNK